MGIYTGSDLAAIPKKPGAYALVSLNPRASRNKEQILYIGHSGGSGLKARLKQHLVELTGTWTNGKHAVIIDVNQVDVVYYWLAKPLNTYAQGSSDKVIAEAIEKIAKEKYQPMITDSSPPSQAAVDLSNNPRFLKAAKKHLDENRESLELPSRANLIQSISKLQEKLDDLITTLTQKNTLP